MKAIKPTMISESSAVSQLNAFALYEQRRIETNEAMSVEDHEPEMEMPPMIRTHDGLFHADEVLAISMMLILHPMAVCRSRKDIDAEFLVDVGGKFDAKRYWDHHQGLFWHYDGSPMTAAGMVWSELGREIVAAVLKAEGIILTSEDDIEDVAAEVNVNLVWGVDWVDAGKQFKPNSEYAYLYEEYKKQLPAKRPVPTELTFSQSVSSLNERSIYGDEQDEAFADAVQFAGKVLIGLIRREALAIEDIRMVQSAPRLLEGKLVLLPRHALIGKWLTANDPLALYTIFPDDKGNWTVLAVEQEAFTPRKRFPVSWNKTTAYDTECACGLQGVYFIHINGFIAKASTKEAAIALATKAVALE